MRSSSCDFSLVYSSVEPGGVWSDDACSHQTARDDGLEQAERIEVRDLVDAAAERALHERDEEQQEPNRPPQHVSQVRDAEHRRGPEENEHQDVPTAQRPNLVSQAWLRVVSVLSMPLGHHQGDGDDGAADLVEHLPRRTVG